MSGVRHVLGTGDGYWGLPHDGSKRRFDWIAEGYSYSVVVCARSYEFAIDMDRLRI